MSLPDMLDVGAFDRSEGVALRFVPERGHGTVILIDRRTIVRECLAQSMLAWTYDIRALSSVDGCASLVSTLACDLIILCGASYSDIADDLSVLQAQCSHCPVMVIFDVSNINTVISTLELGVRGVLSTNSSLGILHGVISLIRSGGTYVPPDCMIAAQRAHTNPSISLGSDAAFTPRQSAIIEAIRKGTPNKIIAYELGMCESTVKVHIRNIMKKLKVRNRTELAFKASKFMSSL